MWEERQEEVKIPYPEQLVGNLPLAERVIEQAELFFEPLRKQWYEIGKVRVIKSEAITWAGITFGLYFSVRKKTEEEIFCEQFDYFINR